MKTCFKLASNQLKPDSMNKQLKIHKSYKPTEIMFKRVKNMVETGLEPSLSQFFTGSQPFKNRSKVRKFLFWLLLLPTNTQSMFSSRQMFF